MSTFDGIVSEFPRIRVDFFRANPSHPAPLACFLSHVHSDHLQGLESLKSPFVYCSFATRRLLLQMEKYPHRINFMRGVLESRKQHYKHLRLVLKGIPLECPTEVELGPLEKVRVTLFDANHCPGAVMFLIEGGDKAVLYTGDIRSEPWWVNSLVRNPILLPYATGFRQLDRIYLDTTFAVRDDVYSIFPSKAQGIRELMEKVEQAPPESIFYLNAWTLGYEEVWIALSSFLRSPVHVDSYQCRLYQSLSEADGRTVISDHAALSGFYVGNHFTPGCLSTQSQVRIHSCEPGTPCHAELLQSKRVVWITPIVTRSKDGSVVPELGAGGGGGDLQQIPELEVLTNTSMKDLEELCKMFISDGNSLSALLSKFETALTARDPKLSLIGLELDPEKEIPLRDFLNQLLASDNVAATSVDSRTRHGEPSPGLPKDRVIQYPFSRHSSYTELCDLVAAFKPVDIYPCTVEVDTWTEEVSIQALFGHLCSGTSFEHDQKMRQLRLKRLENEGPARKRRRRNKNEESQASDLSRSSDQDLHATTHMGMKAQAPDSLIALPVNEICQTDDKDTAGFSGLSPIPKIAAIKAAYEEHLTRGSEATSPSRPSDERHLEWLNADSNGENQTLDSQITITESDLKSQSQTEINAGLQYDGPAEARDDGNSESKSGVGPAEQLEQQTRRRVRIEAYRAAKLALQTSDSGSWDDLGIRSIGSKGHSEREEEL